MTWTRTAAAALATALLAACAGIGEREPYGQGDVDGDVFNAQIVSTLTDDEVADLAASINDFGFDLHRALLTDGGHAGDNVVTAPASVAVLLAMVAAGADGETARQMAEVLRVGTVRDNRFGTLVEQIVDTNAVTLEIANALWVDQKYELLEDYLTWVRQAFDATVEPARLDDPSGVDAIDAWVRQHTNDRIDGIAEDLGLPDPDMATVLANAVYFLGNWTTQFDPALTRDGPFRLSDGTVVQVPTMHRSRLSPGDVFELAVLPGYQVLRLSYGDDQRFGMEIFLPDEDRDLTAFISAFDQATWAEAVAALRPADGVELSMPTFELSWGDSLVDVLRSMGMPLALSADADFSRLSATQLYLEAVVHKTYIRVDEQGTEAAAVTGGGVSVVSAPPTIEIARPFAFTLSDRDTGTILFLGTVEDPRG